MIKKIYKIIKKKYKDSKITEDIIIINLKEKIISIRVKNNYLSLFFYNKDTKKRESKIIGIPINFEKDFKELYDIIDEI